MSPRYDAKGLLSHYLSLKIEPWGADNQSEAEAIVDHIIEASVEAAMAEVRALLDAQNQPKPDPTGTTICEILKTDAKWVTRKAWLTNIGQGRDPRIITDSLFVTPRFGEPYPWMPSPDALTATDWIECDEEGHPC